MFRKKGKFIKTTLFFLISIFFIQLITAYGNSAEINAAISFFDDRNYIEAKRAFEKILINSPDNHLSYFYLGRSERKLGNWEKAVELLKKATELDPKNTQYFRYLALSYFSGVRDAGLFRKPSLAKKGKEAMIKAVELDSKNFDARFVLIAFYIEAPGLFGGDDDKALEHAREAKKLDEVQGYKAFGIYYSLLEEWENAERELLEGLKKYPNSVTLLESLGGLYRRTDRSEEALRIYEKIQKMDPDHLYVYYSIGNLLERLDREPERAIKSLNRFIEMYKGTDRIVARAYFKLGEIYRKQKNKKMAISMYKKALEINPDFEDAEDALEDIG